MVVMRAPAASDTGSAHECAGWPLRCTVQAPHRPIPQPYFVPVSPTCSRITYSRGVSGSTSTLYDLALILSWIMASPPGAWRSHYEAVQGPDRPPVTVSANRSAPPAQIP